MALGVAASFAYFQGANSDRVADIQAARVESCERTYEGVRQIFQPFLPPSPRTNKQRRLVKKFNNRIDTLRARCGQQTGVKP